MRFLIDTDACVAFLNGTDVKVRDRWLGTPAEDVALCSVVKKELFRGAWGSRDPVIVIARLDQFFTAFRSLPFDDRAAERCGQIIAELERAGRLIGESDCMIAAIALAEDLTVVTRNTRHFRCVRSLKLVRW
ncbi:MAG: type II toxin-antitoxin system VapC family toxin [Myxococcales bacterium]|nr:type II toxin-antitoxin system VapC family toxin [Myxococcales bacterium]